MCLFISRLATTLTVGSLVGADVEVLLLPRTEGWNSKVDNAYFTMTSIRIGIKRLVGREGESARKGDNFEFRVLFPSVVLNRRTAVNDIWRWPWVPALPYSLNIVSRHLHFYILN